MNILKRVIRWLDKPSVQYKTIICPSCNGEGETYETQMIYMGTFTHREVEGTRETCRICKGKRIINNPSYNQYLKDLEKWKSKWNLK